VRMWLVDRRRDDDAWRSEAVLRFIDARVESQRAIPESFMHSTSQSPSAFS